MANPAIVQSGFAASSAGTTTLAISFGSNTTSGNIIVAFAQASFSGSNPFTSVADNRNAGNYTLKATVTDSNQFWQGFFFITNISGGATTVTLTLAASGMNREMSIFEISGVNNSNPLPNFLSTKGTSSSASGSVTVANSGDLILACTTWATTIPGSAPTGWTNRILGGSTQTDYQSAAASGSLTYTSVAGSGEWFLQLADLQPPMTVALSGTCTGRSASSGTLRITQRLQGICTLTAANSGFITSAGFIKGSCFLTSANSGTISASTIVPEVRLVSPKSKNITIVVYPPQ